MIYEGEGEATSMFENNSTSIGYTHTCVVKLESYVYPNLQKSISGLNTHSAIAERKVLFVVLLISPSAPFTPFIVFLKHHQIISAITVFANRAHPSRQSTEVVQSLGPPIDFLK
jgi:hypothetical protein